MSLRTNLKSLPMWAVGYSPCPHPHPHPWGSVPVLVFGRTVLLNIADGHRRDTCVQKFYVRHAIFHDDVQRSEAFSVPLPQTWTMLQNTIKFHRIFNQEILLELQSVIFSYYLSLIPLLPAGQCFALIIHKFDGAQRKTLNHLSLYSLKCVSNSWSKIILKGSTQVHHHINFRPTILLRSCPKKLTTICWISTQTTAKLHRDHRPKQ